jgi:molecular chaperone DnaK
VSPDEAVAHGAALYAHLLLQKQGKRSGEPSFTVTDINSHSLGIVGIDSQGRKRNKILVPKNTPLPKTVGGNFKTHKDGQANVVIRILEGESERPEACIEIGTCTIANLPPDLPAGSPVRVSYTYHANGRLEVRGGLKGQSAVTTVFKRENALNSDEMKLWVECFGADLVD